MVIQIFSNTAFKGYNNNLLIVEGIKTLGAFNAMLDIFLVKALKNAFY